MTQQPLSWVSTKKTKKKMYLQRYMHPYVYFSIIHSGQDMNTRKVSFDRRLNKEEVVRVNKKKEY